MHDRAVAASHDQFEPRDVDGLPAYVSGIDTARVRGVGVASAPGGAPATVLIDRAPEALPGWMGPDRRPPQLGTDFTVRRVLWTPFSSALVALDDMQESLGVRPSTYLGRRTARPRSMARLSLRRADAVRHEELLWIPATLHRRASGHAMPVDVIVEPWSVERTEVRMQVRGDRRRIRLPRDYFDVAHALIDRVRFEVEVRVGERSACPRKS